MTSGLEPGGTAIGPDVRTVSITLPTGQKWAMPAWMAAAMLEALAARERPTWNRLITAVTTGDGLERPGRKGGSDG